VRKESSWKMVSLSPRSNFHKVAGKSETRFPVFWIHILLLPSALPALFSFMDGRILNASLDGRICVQRETSRSHRSETGYFCRILLALFYPRWARIINCSHFRQTQFRWSQRRFPSWCTVRRKTGSAPLC